MAESPAGPVRSPGLLGWLVRDGQLERYTAGLAGTAAAGSCRQPRRRVRQILDSLVTGYTMSLQRVERALQQYGWSRSPPWASPSTRS